MGAKRKVLKYWALVVAISFASTVNVAFADTDKSVLQAYISEQTLTVIADSELSSDGLKCTVSNKNTDIVAYGPLYDDGVVIKTTVLLDVSTSMPNDVRSVLSQR